MFQVTVHHHDKDWRNGDLEDKFELIKQENFKTRKYAKEFILRELRKLSGTKKTEWHKGDERSFAWCWTGEKWQHENSGEMMEEYYQYILEKCKIY